MKHGALIRIKRFAQYLFLIVAFANVAFAEEARVIQLKNRTAAEVIPVVQPLLGPNDALTGMDYRLIVRTSDKNFQEIEKLLTQIDTARRQLRVAVKQTVDQNRESSDIGVSGNVGNGDVRVQLPRQRQSTERGAVVRKDGLRLETQQTRTTSNNSSTQFINVLEGSSAFVRVGQSYPQVQRILQLTGRQQILLAQGVSFHEIVTGFDVKPQMQGSNVLLQITPRLSRISNPTTQLVDFQQYSTTVVVRPGEWVDIGGITDSGQEIRRAILDSASTQTGERRTVLLKVE